MTGNPTPSPSRDSHGILMASIQTNKQTNWECGGPKLRGPKSGNVDGIAIIKYSKSCWKKKGQHFLPV